jgi:hypothetical protein
MTNVEHPINYRRAVLHELAAPSSVAAVPNLGEIASAHAAAQGKIAVQDQALKSDISFAETKLTEQNRQFMDRLALDREMLADYEKQNKWATTIGIANLGVQALGIPAGMKTLEKREAAQKAITNRLDAAVSQRNDANLRMAAAEEERARKQAAANIEATRRLYRVNTGNAAAMNSPYE